MMPRYYVGVSVEETRQYYVTVRIQEYQARRTGVVDFDELLVQFRLFGLMYDAGHRLRDTYEVIAA